MDNNGLANKSRPVWGAWIEIGRSGEGGERVWGRAPYGARGLKSLYPCIALVALAVSRPVWGAWIEISRGSWGTTDDGCRAPYGARGLKLLARVLNLGKVVVAPRMGRVD